MANGGWIKLTIAMSGQCYNPVCKPTRVKFDMIGDWETIFLPLRSNIGSPIIQLLLNISILDLQIGLITRYVRKKSHVSTR